MNLDQFDGHTPGPWGGEACSPYWKKRGVRNPRIHSVVATGDGRTVGINYGNEREPPHEPIRAVGPDGVWTDWGTADARLIAAAPDLLAALIKEREENARLREALFACAEDAGDDPFFNKGGEGYEALFGGEEE